MDPSSSRGPASAGLLMIVADPAWHRLITSPERIVQRVARAMGLRATVVLTSDREVKHLNARHRGRNKPTNVLTFDATPHSPGEIVLAAGVVAREAEAAGKRVGDHLAHLIAHGALHLAGHDHAEAGEARRMEMAEARILGRLGLPNPWRRG